MRDRGPQLFMVPRIARQKNVFLGRFLANTLFAKTKTRQLLDTLNVSADETGALAPRSSPLAKISIYSNAVCEGSLQRRSAENH